MKVAFHFNSSLPGLGNPYNLPLEKLLFNKLLTIRPLRVATKVYVGDFIRYLFPSQESLERALGTWILQSQNGWRRFTPRIENLGNVDVFIICFESLSIELADKLHKLVEEEACYLGAVQIDDSARIHWELYSDALPLRYRISDRAVSILYDELDCDPPSSIMKAEETERLLSVGFERVSFEDTHGKHSLFDKYHNYEQARRVAEWRAKFGDMLGFMTDEVACRLGDHMPELPDKLWSAITTYNNAETYEQYAQVSTTCRRILEYVADCLFPLTDEERNGRKLGPGQYRNRLLAFVEEQTKSSTQIELIASGLDLFAVHVEKLTDLANKGIHSEIQREGACRALLRTVFILGDIVALRPESFPIKPNYDLSILKIKKD